MALPTNWIRNVMECKRIVVTCGYFMIVVQQLFAANRHTFLNWTSDGFRPHLQEDEDTASPLLIPLRLFPLWFCAKACGRCPCCPEDPLHWRMSVQTVAQSAEAIERVALHRGREKKTQRSPELRKTTVKATLCVYGILSDTIIRYAVFYLILDLTYSNILSDLYSDIWLTFTNRTEQHENQNTHTQCLLLFINIPWQSLDDGAFSLILSHKSNLNIQGGCYSKVCGFSWNTPVTSTGANRHDWLRCKVSNPSKFQEPMKQIFKVFFIIHPFLGQTKPAWSPYSCSNKCLFMLYPMTMTYFMLYIYSMSPIYIYHT